MSCEGVDGLACIQGWLYSSVGGMVFPANRRCICHPDYKKESPLKYKRLPTACTLGVTSITEAAKELKPSSVYTLYVGPKAYHDGKHVAALAMETRNPFSPYINLQIDPELPPEAWYVKDEHGNAVGSEGC